MNFRLFTSGVVAALFVTAGAAQAASRVHTFTSASISPDGASVVSVESIEGAPDAKTSPSPSIVIRPRGGGSSSTISCPSAAACTLGSPVWSPQGKRLAYLVRDMKTRNYAVWTSDAAGGNRKPWLAAYKGVLNAPRWSADGSTLALLATAGAHKDIGATQAGAALVGEIGAVKTADVQRIATLGSGGTLTYASPVDLFIYEYDWMPDGRGFAATGAHGNGDDNWWFAKLYAIDRAAASARELYTPKEQINAPRVSPDGKRVAFIGGIMSDFGSVGGDIYVMPSSGGTPTDITPDMPASVNSISWNGADDVVSFTALGNEQSQIGAVTVATKAVEIIWSAPESISADGTMRVSIAHDRKTAAIVRQSYERPPEIYTGERANWKSLTSENAALKAVVRAQSITWKNDGYQIQGWLLGPRSADSSKKHPMIVQIHGGPSAAATPNFLSEGTNKDLIERGYFLFLPNPRGSFGQGETFTAANVKDFGYGDLRDILAGVDAVEKVAPVDDARLGVTGFSYGGYMTMWTVTQTNRFKAAAAGAGIANWQSYVGENGIDTWVLPFFGSSVYDDPAVYAKSSPMTFIKNVKTPTFVFVGERDVECPAPQSQEFWHALDKLGVPTSLVIYAGEGHGIRRADHKRDITARTIAWFDRYLN
ncbi:MAG: hypothetical protein NVS2B17_13680 [Candidatus Velthaea sp.]